MSIDIPIRVTGEDTAASEIAQSLDQVVGSAAAAGQALESIGASSAQADSGLEQVSGEAERGSMSLGELALRGPVAAAALIDIGKAAFAAYGQMKDFAEGGFEGLRVMQAFGDQDMEGLRAAIANTADDTTIQQWKLQADAIGFTTEQFEALLKLDAAKFGEGLTQTGQIVEGVLSGSAEGLRKAGIVIDASEERFKGLSETAKKLEVGMVAVEHGMAVTNDQLESQFLQLAQADTAWANLMSEIQVATAEFLIQSGVLKDVEAGFKSAASWVVAHKEELGALVTGTIDFIRTGVEMAGTLFELVGGFETLEAIFGGTMEAMRAGIGTMQTIGSVIGGVVEFGQSLIRTFQGVKTAQEVMAPAWDGTAEMLGVTKSQLGQLHREIRSGERDWAVLSGYLDHMRGGGQGRPELMVVDIQESKEAIQEWNEEAIRMAALDISSDIIGQTTDLKVASELLLEAEKELVAQGFTADAAFKAMAEASAEVTAEIKSLAPVARSSGAAVKEQAEAVLFSAQSWSLAFASVKSAKEQSELVRLWTEAEGELAEGLAASTSALDAYAERLGALREEEETWYSQHRERIIGAFASIPELADSAVSATQESLRELDDEFERTFADSMGSNMEAAHATIDPILGQMDASFAGVSASMGLLAKDSAAVWASMQYGSEVSGDAMIAWGRTAKDAAIGVADAMGVGVRWQSGILAAFYTAEAVGKLAQYDFWGAATAATAAGLHIAIAAGASGGPAGKAGAAGAGTAATASAPPPTPAPSIVARGSLEDTGQGGAGAQQISQVHVTYMGDVQGAAEAIGDVMNGSVRRGTPARLEPTLLRRTGIGGF